MNPQSNYASSPKDPDTVFLIELVGGFFGLLGLGYMYVGRTEEGILRLAIWLLYNVVAYVTIALLSAIIIGCFLIPFQLAIQIVIPFLSANALKKSIIEKM